MPFLPLLIQRKHRRASVTVLLRGMLLSALLVFSAISIANEEITASEPTVDIRLLIDISGSMKKNDPNNLRIPSVALLTELIPDGDKAGVWTFGQWVNNLVRSKIVDDAWRTNAKEEAKKINSVALYTNIGAVLEKASDDFYKGDADFSNTHFILLTDGMVDIDKDPAKNDAERDRILTTVLDSFKQRGAKIHAISLSKNADLSLMDKLAIQTGGQSAVAESSEELTKIFVQALNQAVPSEEVPIEGNEFAIDSSIEEFTALIFRGEGNVPTEILAPDETIYQYGSTSEDVKWFQDTGYDLITITRPLEGTWKIKSDIQPESRVTVVSNLQLEVSKLPANFFAGEHLNVDVSFIEENKLITNPDFLSLLDVELQLMTEDGKSASKKMSEASNPPANGIFNEAITKLTKVGQYEVTVVVDGKTFKRSKRQVVNLRAPFDFEFSVKSGAIQPYYELVVTPLNDSIKLDATTIFVKTKYPDNSTNISALELDEGKRRWTLQINPDKGDGMYEISVKVKSETVGDKEFQFIPKPFEAEFPIPVGAANQIVSVNEEENPPEALPPLEEPVTPQVEEPEQADTVAPAVIPEAEPLATEETIEETVEEVAEEDDSSLWWIIGSAVTGGLLLIGGLVFFMLKRKKAKQDEPGEILSDSDMAALDDPEDVPVVERAAFAEPEPVEEPPVLDEPELELEEPELEEPVLEEPELEEPVLEEPELEEPVLEPSELEESIPEPHLEDDALDDTDLDFMESETEVESSSEEDDAALDLSSEDLAEVLEDFEPPAEEENESEELDIADIAQAIEESADEPSEALEKEIEEALDINDDDDDDEEFNLEDFDIGDTDDLPDPDEKSK